VTALSATSSPEEVSKARKGLSDAISAAEDYLDKVTWDMPESTPPAKKQAYGKAKKGLQRSVDALKKAMADFDEATESAKGKLSKKEKDGVLSKYRGVANTMAEVKDIKSHMSDMLKALL